MRFLKLPILVSVLFFGMAYGQKSSKPKPTKEEVVYKDTDKVDKKAHFSKPPQKPKPQKNPTNTDLNKIDGYEDFPEETKKEIQKFISEYKCAPPFKVSTNLSFIIERDGTMSNILAEGENESFNKEMERVVKEDIKDKWIPAEIKGKKVRFYYNMLIRMKYQ